MIAENPSRPLLPPTHPLFDVLAALDRGSNTEAVRLFLERLPRIAPHAEGDLLHRVAATIGKESAIRLVESFAIHPCFYCERGHGVCEDCGGKGILPSGKACEACLMLGQVGCDFCNGSGWITINMVPRDFQLAVIAIRVHRAAARAERLLGEQLPKVVPGHPAGSWQFCRRLLLDLDRTEGAAENTLIALPHLLESRPEDRNTIARLKQSCIDLASHMDKRIRQLLLEMSDLADGYVDAAGRGTRMAAVGADFWRDLQHRSLANTWLEHPFARLSPLFPQRPG